MAPIKVTVVLDKTAKTRELVEASGRFVLQVPVTRKLSVTDALGTPSLHDDADKLVRSGVRLFDMPGHDVPFVDGCAAWLDCRIIAEPHIQSSYGLFIADVEAAWADSRVFRDGRWLFASSESAWHTLHHESGGRYHAIGDILDVQRGPDEGPGA